MTISTNTNKSPSTKPSPPLPKVKIKHSLQWRLVCILTLVVLLFSSVVAGFGAWQGYKQAQKLQDMKLASLVSLAKSHDLTFKQNQINVNFDYDLPNQDKVNLDIEKNAIDVGLFNTDELKNQTIIFWLQDKRLQSYFDKNVLADLSKKADGLHDITGKQGIWRIYLFTADPKNTDNNILTTRLVVAEKSDIRHILAWQSAKQIMLPLLLLIPLLVLVLVLTINQLFLPLRTATEILQHSSKSPNKLITTTYNDDLNLLINDELVADLPTEIQPFLRLIQQQIKDLVAIMATNQRFIANASHQLRTPMTAVLLQAEQLKYLSAGTPSFHDAVNDLLTSIKRNNQLMNQLLLLAKTEQAQLLENSLNFSAVAVISQLLIDFYPLAEQKQLNLGVEQLSDMKLPISELGFKIIVQNLIENAIKYTPNGGKIDVALYPCESTELETTVAILSVKDSGQGIDEQALTSVIEPFYQTDINHASQGFGLGLSIVSNLVNNSGATLKMFNHYSEAISSNLPNIIGFEVQAIWRLESM